MNLRTFFAELKRRRVYSVAVAYAVGAWLLVQVATQVFPFFHVPNWGIQLVVLASVIGFPVAVVLSWAFEITSGGIKRDADVDRRSARKTGRKLTALVVVLAAFAVVVMVFRFVHSQAPGGGDQGAAAVAAIPSKSIAVLPFENLSAEKANAYFAEAFRTRF